MSGRRQRQRNEEPPPCGVRPRNTGLRSGRPGTKVRSAELSGTTRPGRRTGGKRSRTARQRSSSPGPNRSSETRPPPGDNPDAEGSAPEAAAIQAPAAHARTSRCCANDCEKRGPGDDHHALARARRDRPPFRECDRERARCDRGLERSDKDGTARNVAASTPASRTVKNTRGDAGFRARAPGHGHHALARARWNRRRSLDRVGTTQHSGNATASGRAAKRVGEVRQGRHSQERRGWHSDELHPAKHARGCGFPRIPRRERWNRGDEARKGPLLPSYPDRKAQCTHPLHSGTTPLRADPEWAQDFDRAREGE